MNIRKYFRLGSMGLRHGTYRVDQVLEELIKHNIIGVQGAGSEYEMEYDIGNDEVIVIHCRFGDKGIPYAWMCERWKPTT